MNKLDMPGLSESVEAGNQLSIMETKAANTIEQSAVKDKATDIHSFTLRVSRDVIDQIHAMVLRHPVIRNRNTWIVNAIVEQLKREGQS